MILYQFHSISPNRYVIGAGGGSRTHTNVTSQDFESCASANSATPAFFYAFCTTLIYNNKLFLKFQVVSKIILNYFQDYIIIILTSQNYCNISKIGGSICFFLDTTFSSIAVLLSIDIPNAFSTTGASFPKDIIFEFELIISVAANT